MHRAVKRGEDGQYAGGLTYGPGHLVRWVGFIVVIVPAVASTGWPSPKRSCVSRRLIAALGTRQRFIEDLHEKLLYSVLRS
jgi:hypothetical protein